MAKIYTAVLTVDGSTTIPLKNYRGSRRIYTVYLSGTFGSGTVTAFVQADGTNNIAILDSANNAISKTSNAAFNFEAYSDPTNPVKLIITLAGSTGASINLNVCDNS